MEVGEGTTERVIGLSTKDVIEAGTVGGQAVEDGAIRGDLKVRAMDRRTPGMLDDHRRTLQGAPGPVF